MTRAIFLIAWLALAAPAFADLVWEKPTQSFRPGEDDLEVVAHFQFTNTGKTPVKITRVETSCGCTTAQLERRTYAAGESGEVTAVFTIGGRRGPQEKMIAVTTDASEEPTTLTMLVTLPETLTIEPQFVYWGDQEALEPKTVRVTLPEKYTAIRLTAATTDKHLTAEVRPVKAGHIYDVLLTPTKADRSLMVELTLTAELPGKKERKASAYARLP